VGMTEKRRQKRIPSVGLALKGRTPYRLKIKKLKNYLKIKNYKIYFSHPPLKGVETY